MTKKDAKKKLMDAAMLFVRQGHTPSARELAEEAGVNLAAISYYFQGKDNLIAEALDTAAIQDLEAWITEHLPPELPPYERLRHFCRFLGRIHRDFPAFSHAQLVNITLKGRPERATALAIDTLAMILDEFAAHTHDMPIDTRVRAISLMSSLHYVSIFRTQFEDIAHLQIDSNDELYAYIDALLDHQKLTLSSEVSS